MSLLNSSLVVFLSESSVSLVCCFSALERKTKSPLLETLERRQSEENAVVHSLFTYFGNKLSLEDKELFSRGVDEVFAHSVLMSVSTEGDPLLVEQVKEHLQANGLQVRQEVISKVTSVVVFVGICCCCSVLVQCMNCWKHIF